MANKKPHINAGAFGARADIGPGIHGMRGKFSWTVLFSGAG